MAVYMIVSDSSVRKACEEAILRYTAEQTICAEGSEELQEFLNLYPRKKAGDISLVILDSRSPDYDGRIVELLSQRPALRDTGFLLICSKQRPLEQSSMAGRNRYLDVVTTLEEIDPRIRSALQFAECIRERRSLELEMRRVLRKEKQVIEGRDPRTGLPGLGTFLQFLEREWNRCLRYDWDITVIACAIEGLAPLDSTQAENLYREMAQGIADCVHRPGDMVGVLREGRLGIVLSGTTQVGAEHVSRRIRDQFAEWSDRNKAQGLIRLGTATERPLQLYRSLRGPQARAGYEHILDLAVERLSTE